MKARISPQHSDLPAAKANEKGVSACRDEWLRLDDTALLSDCRQQRYRGSGPGGQHRNKVETAIRLRHQPSEIVVQAEESRSLEENRLRALRRLREQIAIEIRVRIDPLKPLAPEFLAQLGPKGTLRISRHNPSYPIIIATVLDALNNASGSYADAASMLGITTSQLVKLLRRDSHLWKAICERPWQNFASVRSSADFQLSSVNSKQSAKNLRIKANERIKGIRP